MSGSEEGEGEIYNWSTPSFVAQNDLPVEEGVNEIKKDTSQGKGVGGDNCIILCPRG